MKKWTLGEIATERKRLESEISEHEAEIKIQRAELRVLEARCWHPNDLCDEDGKFCPDCGRS